MRRSHPELFKAASQAKLLDAVPNKSADLAQSTAAVKTVQQSSIEPKIDDGPEQVSPTTRLQKPGTVNVEKLGIVRQDGDEEGSQGVSIYLTESTAQSSKTASTASSSFGIQASKHGVLGPLSSNPPKNIQEIRERLHSSRGTASPTGSYYEDYINTVGRAVNEATMVIEVGGHMLKKHGGNGYTRAFNQTFTSFPKDVGFNNGLSAPQPDFVEGPVIGEFKPFPVGEHVNGAVLYKDNPHSLTLPHLAGEWKRPGKDMTEARLQSAYDEAALVYARNQALSLVGKSDPPGHVEFTTFTTDGSNLSFFAHYAAPSDDDKLEYHQYKVKSINLVDSYEEHKAGRRGIRNEQDHAMERLYALRDELKEHCKQRRGETNADEDED